MPEGLDWIMDAFYRLSASRRTGMSVGAIPFEAADAYAHRYGINAPDDFDEFYTLLRATDNAYLEALQNKEGDGPTKKTASDDTVETTHGR